MKQHLFSLFLCVVFGVNCTVEPEPKGPLDGKDGANGITHGENGEDGQDATD